MSKIVKIWLLNTNAFLCYGQSLLERPEIISVFLEISIGKRLLFSHFVAKRPFGEYSYLCNCGENSYGEMTVASFVWRNGRDREPNFCMEYII